jgi:hypothetical protein
MNYGLGPSIPDIYVLSPCYIIDFLILSCVIECIMFTDLADLGTMGPQAASYNTVQGNKHIILYLKHSSSMIIGKTL